MTFAGNIIDQVIIIAAIGLALCLYLMAVLLWSRRRSAQTQKMEYRLGLLDAPEAKTRVLRLWHEGKEVTTTVQEHIEQLQITAWLRHIHRDAGLNVPMATVILGTLAGMAGVMVIMMLITKVFILSMVSSLIVPMVVWIVLTRRISRRMELFEMQFVDSLGLASRSLRAGHPLIGSFRLISEEVAAPVGVLFGEIVQQQMLGVSLEQAILRSAALSRSRDMKLFATSVLIQLRSGGNLADMMDRLAAVVRDRMRLSRRVRVLTAQTQFSKRVLIALPIIMFLLISAVNQTYMLPMYTTTMGKMMLLIATGLLILGAWMMNRLAVLRY